MRTFQIISATTNTRCIRASDSLANNSLFSLDKVELYKKWYEEGYDLNDPSYIAWLKINHPTFVAILQQSHHLH